MFMEIEVKTGWVELPGGKVRVPELSTLNEDQVPFEEVAVIDDDTSIFMFHPETVEQFLELMKKIPAKNLCSFAGQFRED